MEKRRKRMIKQCLSFALSLVMALTIVTPVKAAQQQYVPTQEDIEITKNIKDIQTAGYYSAALMKNGDLWTWGSMAAMDKYHAIDSSLYTPKTPSVFMTNVKEFVLTDTYYAAIKNDGTLWMWGCDTNGELGIGDCELNNFFPRQVNIPKRVKKVILSNKGWNKTAAITEDGDLYMWGDNSAYGLGIGENSDNSKSYNTPQKVNGISDVSDVSICGSTTTAITSSGKVYAWGNIYEYRDQMTHYTPEEVKNIEHISGQITKIQFSQAGYTALTENGDLYAWYYSDMDENYAGRNDSEDKTIPKMILSNIKSYVPYAINFNVENLKSVVLPGTSVGPTQSGNLYAPYWFILTNKTEAKKLVESLYFENEENEEETSNTDNNGQVIDIPTSETNEIKIEVLNASGSKNKLNKVQKLLKEKGYNVKTNDVEVISKTTIINNTDVDGKYIEQIQELLGVGVLSSSATASNNTDVTIIIGKDYK